MMKSSLVVLLLIGVVSVHIAPSEAQRSLDNRPRPSNVRFPQRLKIINDNEGGPASFNNNNNNNAVVQHYPNPLAQGPPYYGPPLPDTFPVECVCPCTKEYLPMCGSDRRTYGNNCLFQCQRRCNPALTFKYCGTCEEPNEDVKQPPCF